MLENEITSVVGKSKKRKRIGRGPGSGHGKTAGKGHKGQNSRAGAKSMKLSEGGQMPLFRRIPKRGFSNADFCNPYDIVNVSQLERFDSGASIDAKMLLNAGIIGSVKNKIKVLGDGELTKKLTVLADKFSKSAQEKIQASGGTVKFV